MLPGKKIPQVEFEHWIIFNKVDPNGGLKIFRVPGVKQNA
jgi:hypothetical protein